mgnify:CR=1 FL=1
MSHETECNVMLTDQHGRPAMPPWTCNCDSIRAAYQRGRKDAAEAIETLKGYSFGVTTRNNNEPAVGYVIFNDAIDAAYGEQVGNPEQLDGEQA